MWVCDYFQCLVFINTQELPLLPPFGIPVGDRFAQSLSDSDLLDILLFATPKKWQHQMDRMGFDPMAMSPDARLTFMENCEVTEDYDTANMTVAHTPNNSKNGNNKGAKPSDPKKQKCCDNHGWSNHTMAECNQNKPGFNSFKKGNNQSKAKAFGDKTNAKSWQLKNDKPTKEVKKKDMNAVMKKHIRQHIRKEITAISKKKAESNLNMLDVALQDFNYEVMDNMKIDSDCDQFDKDLEFSYSEGEISV